jgi:phosphoglycolate phosphatase
MILDRDIDWKSFDTYIFDLDGTLVDSLHQIETSLDVTRMNFGYEKTPKGLVYNNLGLPLRQLFSDLKMSQSVQDEFITFFRRELAQQISISNQLFGSVIELMLLIRTHGIKVAIATSKPTYLANQVIQNSEISGMIDCIQGTDDFPSKPDPEVIRRCISALKSKSAIMIGDRKEDVLAAAAAGIPAIGIAQSAHSEDLLKASGAFLTFKSIDLFYKCVNSSIGFARS